MSQSSILINSDKMSVQNSKDNIHYHGYPLLRPHVSEIYFSMAQNFWRTQTLNGMPMDLQSVEVIAAQNNVIPYNSVMQKRALPIVSPNRLANRVAWYNVKFNHGETGWICNKMYGSVANAAQDVLNDTLVALYVDKKIIACVKQFLSESMTKSK